MRRLRRLHHVEPLDLAERRLASGCIWPAVLWSDFQSEERIWMAAFATRVFTREAPACATPKGAEGLQNSVDRKSISIVGLTCSNSTTECSGSSFASPDGSP